MPPVLTLEVAIVAVRAFGIGRGFFRYTERLVSHDAVFRALTDLRVAVWRRLEVLAPQGLAGFRRGDLLARMVADVDSVQDLALRVVLPVSQCRARRRALGPRHLVAACRRPAWSSSWPCSPVRSSCPG